MWAQIVAQSLLVSLPCLGAGGAHAGQVSARIEFDVASIKASNPKITTIRRQVAHGTFTAGETVRMFIMEAYDVSPMQIEGGPPWAQTDFYDIQAQGRPGRQP